MRLLVLCLLLTTNAFALGSDSAQTIETYNLGMAYGFVPLVKERKKPLINRLKNASADILCLQEVWTDEDVNDIKSELKSQYPYSYSVPRNQKYADKKPACSIGRLFGKGSAGRCMFKKCRGKKGDEFTQCILVDCKDSIENLKKKDLTCASAFFAQAGNGMLKGMMNILNPFKRVGLFAYEGSSGLVLLSKVPLKDTSFFEMKEFSTTNRRAALYAKANVKGQDSHILCTHLTAELSRSVPYTGTLSSWAEESQYQAAYLSDKLAQKAESEPQIFLGDFNCSYKNDELGIHAEAEGTCKVIADKGFDDFITTKNTECSYCSSNTLNGSIKNVLLDHIFTKGISKEDSNIRVIYKEKVEVEEEDGRKIQTNLSDHYGIQLSL